MGSLSSIITIKARIVELNIFKELDQLTTIKLFKYFLESITLFNRSKGSTAESLCYYVHHRFCVPQLPT